MFNDSKYTNWYNAIISNAKLRNLDCYTERHHIVPKCMGGDNNPENLVKLTAREHFICHRLLIKMVDSTLRNKLVYAAWQQSRSAKLKNVPITSRTFAMLKEELSNTYAGRKRPLFSKEWRDNMSSSHKGEKNFMFNRNHSTETIEKMSRNRSGKCLGENNPFYGKTHSPDVIKNIVESNKTEHVCPKCGKSGKSNSMKRWHFNNCKFT